MNGERFIELRKDEHCPSFGFNIKGGYDTGCPVYVWRVEPGSLADRYGLKSGDEILQANGIDFTRIEHGEALKLLKGKHTLCLYIKSHTHSHSQSSGGQITSNTLSASNHTLTHSPHAKMQNMQMHQHQIQQQSVSLDYPLNSSLCLDDDAMVYSSNAEFYTWVDRMGAPVSPPRITESWPKRNVDIEIQPGQNLGLMIRGGSEYGLGIYVTGVDPGSVAERAGLQRGDEIIEVNGRLFTTITHDKAVAILKSSRKMSIVASFIGKIPADLTFEPQVKLVEDDIDKCTNILAMIEEKARTVLTKSEHSRFTFYREEYQQGFLPVHTFVRILLELLSTHEKYTLLTEVREIIRPGDRSIFDELIYKPISSNSSNHGGAYIGSHIDDTGLHLENNRSPGGSVIMTNTNNTGGQSASDLVFLREFNGKNDPMCRTSPITNNSPINYTQDGNNGIKSQINHSSTPAVRFRVRVPKTKPLLGIAIEGGINTPHRLPRIININADGSAFNTSMKPGQVLLSVDGKKLDGLTHEDIARLITESFSDTNKANIEFIVVEAKNNNTQIHQQQQGMQQPQQSGQLQTPQSMTHQLHPHQQTQQQQQQPSSIALCSNN